MKTIKLLILTLITVLGFFQTKAQTNYLLPNSVADLRLLIQNTSYAGGQHRDTSTTTTSQEVWFVTPPATVNGTAVQGGDLQVIISNPRATWTKVSLYDFTGTNLMRTQNIAPNGEIIFGRYYSSVPHFTPQDLPLDGSKDYYWRFETVSNQVATINPDSKTVEKNNYEDVFVFQNDLNIPPSGQRDIRVKAGQTITGITVEYKQSYFKVTAGNTDGIYYFVYEVFDPFTGSVYGEATVSITVAGVNQYCELEVVNEKLQVGSETVHEFTLYSPNAGINPFNYTVSDVASGNIVKSGTTPPATSNKELIDFGTLPTGTYSVVIKSSTSNCYAVSVVEHINPSQACSVNIISIDKIGGTNSYTVNSPFSNTNTIKLEVRANGSTSTVISQSGIGTQTYQISLPNSASGTFFVNVSGEGGKTCSANKSFEHSLVILQNGATKLETYTKFIHNYSDNWVISGKEDNASGRDKFGITSIAENKTNKEWKTFVSDFSNEGNSPNAKAILGIKKDTSKNCISVSIAVMPNRIVMQYRSVKSGTTDIVASILGITAPCWVKIVKTGNDATAYYSSDLSMNPAWLLIGSIQNCFTGFGKYQVFLGATSAKTDVLAEARFRGHLGGVVDFTSSPPSNLVAPIVVSNVSSPQNGQSLTLSTNCQNGSTVKWYKNNGVEPVLSGSPISVVAKNASSYYARCENSLAKSSKSNILLFSFTETENTICGITDKTKLGDKTYQNANYGVFARVFNNKLWVTQSVSSTPESFVVRGLNFLNSDFTKTWTGSDFTCFELGSSIDGLSEPNGFSTPMGYTLSTTVDGAKVYTKTVINNNPTCSNGGNFSITSVVKTTGGYNVLFNSANLSTGRVLVRNSSNAIVQDISQIFTSNPQLINFGSLTNGQNYTVQFVGQSCQGSSNTFNFAATTDSEVEGSINAPTISILPLNPISGTTITLTSSGCSSGYVNHFYEGLTLLGIGNSYTTTAVSGANYYAKCATVCESTTQFATVTVGASNTCIDGMTNPTASSQLQGNVEYGAPLCNAVEGFALNSTNSAEVVTVDIYIGGYYVGSAPANLGPNPDGSGVRQDLIDAFGVGFGQKKFHFDLPTASNLWWKNGSNKTLTVKFGGTKTNLATNQSGGYIINCVGSGSGVCSSSPQNTNQEKVLVLGNSIVHHPPLSSIGWAGDWGMAASSASTDMISRLRSHYVGLNASSILIGHNIANFEANYATIVPSNESQFTSIRDAQNWTTIIVRLGENVNEQSNYSSTVFKQKLLDLVNFIKNGRNGVKVIVTNCFWTNTIKDADLQSFATTNGFSFASLAGLYQNQGANTAWVGSPNGAVLSNADPAVKDHPNDAGMQAIANRIISAIN